MMEINQILYKTNKRDLFDKNILPYKVISIWYNETESETLYKVKSLTTEDIVDLWKESNYLANWTYAFFKSKEEAIAFHNKLVLSFINNFKNKLLI